MRDIEEIWRWIEAWLNIYAPEALKNLNKGASEEDMEQLEKDLGYRLPEDVRASLRIHNGTADTFADLWQLLSLGGIRQQQQVQMKVLHSLQEYADEEDEENELWWWYSSWIPVAYDGSGDLLCVDVAPPTNEQFGQIIEFDHEAGSRRIALSFHALLSNFVDDLEAGKYTPGQYGHLKSEHLLFTQSQLPPDATFEHS